MEIEVMNGLENREDKGLDYETVKTRLFSLGDPASHCRPMPEFTKEDIQQLVRARLKYFLTFAKSP